MATFMVTLGCEYNYLLKAGNYAKNVCSVRFISKNELRRRSKTKRKPNPKDYVKPEDFPVFKIKGKEPWYEAQFRRKAHTKSNFLLDVKMNRFEKMKDTDDWKAIWPTAASFKMFSVPLALRQGVVQNRSENKGIVPDKFANLELMKIPNFLHLTPQHVKTHCEALKVLCTTWPEGITIKDAMDHFPLEIISRSYCFAGASIRDERARVVTLKISLDKLNFTSERAKDKFLDLVRDKYDEKTGILTLTSDRCPTKKQNEDFLMYLLTALYQESHLSHPWEELKEFEDHREYIWENSESTKRLISFIEKVAEINENSEFKDKETSEILESPKVKTYGLAVKKMEECGENSETLRAYKESVFNLLSIKPLDSNTEQSLKENGP